MVNVGFNVRPTEVNAAIARIQLRKLKEFNNRRNHIASYWRDEFQSLQDDKLLSFVQPTENTEHQWFGFPAFCKDEDTKKRFKQHLEDSGIETRPLICGNLTKQPAFQTLEYRISGNLKGADKIMETGIYWGLHPNHDR